jgi:hypothetical protein
MNQPELAVPVEIYEKRKWRMMTVIKLGAPDEVIRLEAQILLSSFK